MTAVYPRTHWTLKNAGYFSPSAKLVAGPINNAHSSVRQVPLVALWLERLGARQGQLQTPSAPTRQRCLDQQAPSRGQSLPASPLATQQLQRMVSLRLTLRSSCRRLQMYNDSQTGALESENVWYWCRARCVKHRWHNSRPCVWKPHICIWNKHPDKLLLLRRLSGCRIRFVPLNCGASHPAESVASTVSDPPIHAGIIHQHG